MCKDTYSGGGHLVSVIVPVYKVEKYLDKCVESIVTQSYTNLEIILVDDGSPDHSPELCDKWVDRDLRIKVIHKQNGGLSSARNAALKIAGGEYIVFVDSDDQISKEYVFLLLTTAERYEASIVVCDSTNNITCLDQSNNLKEETITVSDDALLYYLQHESHAVWNKIYKKDILKGVFFEEGEQNEDIMYNYSVIKCAKRLVHINKTLYYWNIEPQSLTRSPLTSLKNQCARVAALARKEIKREDVAIAADVRMCSAIFRFMTRAIRFGFATDKLKKDYRDALSDYVGILKKNESHIMASDIFRRIDKVNMWIIMRSYRFFCLIYQLELMILKLKSKRGKKL